MGLLDGAMNQFQIGQNIGKATSPVGGLGANIEDILKKASDAGLIQRQLNSAEAQTSQRIASQEGISQADRLSRESVSGLDRGSREAISIFNRGSIEDVAERDRGSREGIAESGQEGQNFRLGEQIGSTEGIAARAQEGLNTRQGISEEGLNTRQGISEEGLNTRQGISEEGLNTRQGVSEGGLNTRQGISEGGQDYRQERRLANNLAAAKIQQRGTYDPAKERRNNIFESASAKKDSGAPLTPEEEAVYNKEIGSPFALSKEKGVAADRAVVEESRAVISYLGDISTELARFKNAADTGKFGRQDITYKESIALRNEYFEEIMPEVEQLDIPGIAQLFSLLKSMPIDTEPDQMMQAIYGYMSSTYPENQDEINKAFNPNYYKSGGGGAFF